MTLKIINNSDQLSTREKIISIALQNRIDFSAIAFAVGLTPQTFNYQLYHSSKFDVELEQNIYKYFKQKGIVAYTEEETIMANDLFLEFTSIQAQHISILATEIRESVKNGELEPDERERICVKIKNMRDDLIKGLDELQLLAEGKQVKSFITVDR